MNAWNIYLFGSDLPWEFHIPWQLGTSPDEVCLQTGNPSVNDWPFSTPCRYWRTTTRRNSTACLKCERELDRKIEHTDIKR